jgi:hypothetical protein
MSRRIANKACLSEDHSTTADTEAEKINCLSVALDLTEFAEIDENFRKNTTGAATWFMVITVKLNSNQHSEHIIPHCD